MESTYKITLFLLIFLSSQKAFSQSEKAFCKAVESMNFKKVERIVHRIVKKNRAGQTYFNGEGSGYQINLSPCYDSIVNWLKKQDCVEDAYWDKCQSKELIYPGSSSIGVKFKTKTGIAEKCFLVQNGTTGQVNIFGWKPKISKAKKNLVYKKMYECKGFIELQKLNCYPYSKRVQNNDSILSQKLIGIWRSIKLPKDAADKGIEFKVTAQNELILIVDSFFVYTFSSFVSKTALSGLGVKPDWPPYYCYVKQLDENHIQVEYESLQINPVTITYKRAE
jgi:hypothetical protein